MLRQDNADLRLRGIGYEIGLVDEETYNFVLKKQEIIDKEVSRMFETTVGANKSVQDFLESMGSASVKKSTTLAELICRPELCYESLLPLDIDRERLFKEYLNLTEDNIFDNNTVRDIINQININVKYDGYIKRQQTQINSFKKMETRHIPDDIDYDLVPSLRLEARQKLKEFRPVSVGQASRISGVSPADISVLLVFLDSSIKSDKNKN